MGGKSNVGMRDPGTAHRLAKTEAKVQNRSAESQAGGGGGRGGGGGGRVDQL